MATAEGVFPKVGGDPLYVSEVNYLARPLVYYYSGTGANLTYVGGSGVYELEYLPVGSILGAKYIRLCLSSEQRALSATGVVSVGLKCQHREISGTYSDVAPGTVNLVSADYTTVDDIRSGQYNVVHPLNTAELASGIQIRLFSSTTGTSGGGTAASFTLKQFTGELI